MCENKNKIQLSFIVPVYNVEKYLPECIESLLRIQSINIEVVLINDGSTDSSGAIADQYVIKDNRIKTIHQVNKGLSATRNRGIYESRGEYISFIDSDDWIFDGKVEDLYKEVKNHQADIIMGGMLFCYSNGITSNLYDSIPDSITHILLSGKRCFVELAARECYFPMVCSHIYRKEWVIKQKLHFKNVIHEDELWMPTALCLAEKVIVTKINFYGYRQQRDGSVMNSLKIKQHISSLIIIANQLILFCNKFSDTDLDVKSQLFAQAFNLYARAFNSLLNIRDSSYILPDHFLFIIHQTGKMLTSNCERTCFAYYRRSIKNLKQYLLRRRSFALSTRNYTGKELLILVYNIPWNNQMQISLDNFDKKFILTFDHKYIKEAKIIVFYLPTLYADFVDGEIEKPDEQQWVAWDINNMYGTLINTDSEINSFFNIYFSLDINSKNDEINLQQKFVQSLFFNIQKSFGI